MIKIVDIGFIIYKKKYDENSLIIKILTQNNGIISGYFSNTDKNIIQNESLVKFIWSAKNITQLGTLEIELIKSYTSYIISDKFYIELIELINVLINVLIYEKITENSLFDRLKNIIFLIYKKKNKLLILKEFVYFYNLLLNTLGTGIVFNQNKKQTLFYISPKSGKAVSQIEGEKYKKKLFLFPKIFQDQESSENDIYSSIEIINFFLKKYLNENNYINQYQVIILFIDKLLKSF